MTQTNTIEIFLPLIRYFDKLGQRTFFFIEIRIPEKGLLVRTDENIFLVVKYGRNVSIVLICLLPMSQTYVIIEDSQYLFQ
jgi:hypothetical protein